MDQNQEKNWIFVTSQSILFHLFGCPLIPNTEIAVNLSLKNELSVSAWHMWQLSTSLKTSETKHLSLNCFITLYKDGRYFEEITKKWWNSPKRGTTWNESLSEDLSNNYCANFIWYQSYLKLSVFFYYLILVTEVDVSVLNSFAPGWNQVTWSRPLAHNNAKSK
jgi:hypothetical protein